MLPHFKRIFYWYTPNEDDELKDPAPCTPFPPKTPPKKEFRFYSREMREICFNYLDKCIKSKGNPVSIQFHDSVPNGCQSVTYVWNDQRSVSFQFAKSPPQTSGSQEHSQQTHRQTSGFQENSPNFSPQASGLQVNPLKSRKQSFGKKEIPFIFPTHPFGFNGNFSKSPPQTSCSQENLQKTSGSQKNSPKIQHHQDTFGFQMNFVKSPPQTSSRQENSPEFSEQSSAFFHQEGKAIETKIQNKENELGKTNQDQIDENPNENSAQGLYQLTTEDYENAYNIHIKHSHWTFKQIQEELSTITRNPRLKNMNSEKFKSECQTFFSIRRGKQLSPASPLNEVELYKRQIDFLKHPRNVMTQHVPGEPSHEGPWSALETNQLIEFFEDDGIQNFKVENGGINWMAVSRFIPGRTGEQCQRKYKELKSEGFIRDLENESFHFSPDFEINQMKALSEEEEKSLYEYISYDIDNNNIVTRSQIAEAARKKYYHSVSIVRKALYRHYINRKIFDIKGQVLPEFAVKYQKKFNKFMKIADKEPHKLMNRYNIPEFAASMAWVSGFMKRYSLVFRCAHYERRGAIQREWVDSYLMKVAKAFAKFGPDRVLNMDETHVSINNFPGKVISHKGQKTVSIQCNYYNKAEGFTAMATCSRSKTLPIIVIAKGKTSRSINKFKKGGNVESRLLTSETGWTTVSIMEQYLQWIYDQMGKEPFALIVDCFKAHINQKIKDLAKSLKIDLIIVPACGIGSYQPLDRRIFGIVKNKIRSHENFSKTITSKDFQKDRYNIVCQAMEKAWKQVSQEALSAAWDIPGLTKLTSTEINE